MDVQVEPYQTDGTLTEHTLLGDDAKIPVPSSLRSVNYPVRYYSDSVKTSSFESCAYKGITVDLSE